jgi:tRNA(Ile2) C34 agmatinyltransferase TiaS
VTEKHKFQVIHGTPAPDTPAEQVKKRLRKTRVRNEPICPSCGGRTFTIAQTGTTKQKWCAFCMMQGRMVVMT